MYPQRNDNDVERKKGCDAELMCHVVVIPDTIFVDVLRYYVSEFDVKIIYRSHKKEY